jgi:hypothetical protein
MHGRDGRGVGQIHADHEIGARRHAQRDRIAAVRRTSRDGHRPTATEGHDAVGGRIDVGAGAALSDCQMHLADPERLVAVLVG